ncbi:MAG: hypothetical protein ACPGTP_06305 [Bacteroidia bacterium]
MKKFLITLLYASLATLVVGYLFRVLHYPEFKDVTIFAFWLHIGSYLGYSLLVKDKDDRMMYPMIMLLAVVSVTVFNISLEGVMSPVMLSTILFLLFLGYVSYHLLTRNYLDTNELKILSKLNMVAIALCIIATVFKLSRWPYADKILIAGCGSVAFMLLLTGVTKGLKRDA